MKPWILAVALLVGCIDGPPSNTTSNNANNTNNTNSNNMTGCESNDDCTELPWCDTRQNVCFGCFSNTDCAPGVACDVELGFCRECTSAEDCGSTTPVCGPELRCQSCTSDLDCPFGICDPSGACVECNATDETACTDQGVVCDIRQNICSDFAVGTTSSCSTCVSNLQCAEGVCANSGGDAEDWRCLFVANGGCPRPFEIVENLETITGTIEPRGCLLNPVTSCDAYANTLAAVECQTDNQCSMGGICYQEYCDLKCVDSDEQCVTNRECIDGRCEFIEIR